MAKNKSKSKTPTNAKSSKKTFRNSVWFWILITLLAIAILSLLAIFIAYLIIELSFIDEGTPFQKHY